jgi:hypothetical protein
MSAHFRTKELTSAGGSQFSIQPLRLLPRLPQPTGAPTPGPIVRIVARVTSTSWYSPNLVVPGQQVAGAQAYAGGAGSPGSSLGFFGVAGGGAM